MYRITLSITLYVALPVGANIQNLMHVTKVDASSCIIILTPFTP